MRGLRRPGNFPDSSPRIVTSAIRTMTRLPWPHDPGVRLPARALKMPPRRGFSRVYVNDHHYSEKAQDLY
jgi:hypothetical protein